MLTQGANLNIIAEHLPASVGPLFSAKHDPRGRPISRPTAIYYRLYRWLRSKEKEGFLSSAVGVQEAGLGDRPSRWWTASLKGIGLIRQVQSSNHFAHGGENAQIEESSSEKWPKWLRFPSRCSTIRIDAIKAEMAIKTQKNHYMYVRPDPKSEDLHPDLEAALLPVKGAYNHYVDHISTQVIILFDPDNPENVLTLPYRTRFNDRHRQLAALDGFEAAFTEAEKYYDVAVFLTLTTAPGMHPNLWWANRHMAVAWNRYMSYLTKRSIIAHKKEIADADAARMEKNGYTKKEITKYQNSHKYRRYLNAEIARTGRSYRPRYVCCNEFQKNGLIHSHIMIFGRSWLALKSQIEKDWARCGQGQIIDVYAVKRVENGWVWANSDKRPKDAKNSEDAKTYLKKYLNKAIYDRKGFEQYFTINKRFFTASRSMSPAKRAHPQQLDYHPPEPDEAARHYDYQPPDSPRWEFGGVVHQGEVTAQLNFLARRARSRYCRQPRPIELGDAPPIPAPWEVVAADEREFSRRQREDPRLSFVPASTLIAPRAERLNLADFM